MISAIIEEDFITGFKADSEDTRVELDTSTGIKDAVGVTTKNVPDLIGEVSRSHSPTRTKIQEPALEHGKDSDRAGRLNFGAK